MPLRVAVLYGGRSGEHEISLRSAESIIAGLDPAKYQNFALTEDSMLFFFSQGELLAESAGPIEASVPRATVASLLA